MPKDPNLEDDDDEALRLPDEENDGEGEGGDAGQLDNEGGDEAETGQEFEDAQAQEGLGRREKRIQTLSKAAKDAEERASRFERELNEERQRYRPQQQQGESLEQEQARLAMMTTEERMDYRFNKAQQQNAREMAMLRFQSLDMADKNAFEAKAATNAKYKKYAGEVEQLLASERSKGRGFDLSRDTVLKFVLGQKLIENEGKPRQQQRGQDNIRRQTVRADSSRSDVSNNRRRSGDGNSLADLERRLDGKVF